jgi:hypothetical protein
VIALFTTAGGKEGVAARDLCDCVFAAGDESVFCEPVAPGVFYIRYSDGRALEKCLSLNYFRRIIKRRETYAEVSLEEPKGRQYKRIGKYYFLR